MKKARLKSFDLIIYRTKMIMLFLKSCEGKFKSLSVITNLFWLALILGSIFLEDCPF